MSNACDFNLALTVDAESVLNKNLKKKFPKNVNDKGVSNFYMAIRNNEDVIKKFGQDPNNMNQFWDWRNSEDRAVIKEFALRENRKILNEQDEPEVYIDYKGPYILSLTGNSVYLNDDVMSLTNQEFADGINTIAGSFIEDNLNMEPTGYVNNYLSKRIGELKTRLTNLQDEEAQATEVGRRRKIRRRSTAVANNIEKLESVLNNTQNLNQFVRRLELRLQSQNFLVRQETIDKDSEESKDNHDDIVNFLVESNAISNRALDDIEILKFFSSIPQFIDYKPEMAQQSRLIKPNPLFGGPLYMNQSSARSLVERLLADIVIAKPNSNVFEEYKSILMDEAKRSKHPELNYIANYLEGPKVSQSFKVKFFSAMHKTTQNYLLNILEKSDNNTKVSVQIFDPSLTNSQEGKTADNFVEGIINMEGSPSTRIIAARAKAKEQFEKVKNSQDALVYKNFLSELLSEIEVDLHPNSLSNFVTTILTGGSDPQKLDFVTLNKKIKNFIDAPITTKSILEVNSNKAVNGELQMLKEMTDPKEIQKNEAFKRYLISSENSFLRELANTEALYSDRNSEATIFAGGKQRWLYSFVSGLDLMLDRMKSDPEQAFSDLRDKNLLYVNHLLENPDDLEGLKIFTNTELKVPNDPNPTLHKNITALDLHFDILMKMFNSDNEYFGSMANLQTKDAAAKKRKAALANYVVYNFGADKNSLFSIFGLPKPTAGKSNIYNETKQEIGRDFEQILRGYVLGELKRSMDASDAVSAYYGDNLSEVERQDYLMTELIPDYHYRTSYKEGDATFTFNIETNERTRKEKGKKDQVEKFTAMPARFFEEGNYHKIGLFSSSLEKWLDQNEFNEKMMYNKGKGIAPSIKPDFYTAGLKATEGNALNSLMAVVLNDTNEIIKKNYSYLNDITVVQAQDAKGKPVKKNLFSLDTNLETSGTQANMTYDYIISSFIAAYELSNMFNGHISYYKQKSNKNINADDFLKRGSAPGANGQYPMINRMDNTMKTYKTFHGENIKVQAQQNTVVAVVNNIESSTSQFAELISKTRGGEQLLYEHEVADAQGFISPENFRDTVSRLYGWDQKIDQKNYDELNDPNHNVTTENIRWIRKFSKSYTPLKLVHFEVNPSGVPIYLKYSLAPLFPALTSNTEANLIAKQMKEQGVDQVVFKSGSKGSNYGQTTIHNVNDQGRFSSIKPELKFNPFVVNTENLKLQTQVPTKLNKSIAIGNQVIKNILVNIDTESDSKDYFFKGKYHSGQEIYQEIEDTMKNILQTQLNQTLQALGRDPETGEFNVKNIKKFLKGQMDIETETDILHFLDTDLPLDTIPNFTQRAFPVISSFINKNAGKVYTNGGSVVQVANVGFDRVTDAEKEGIFFFDKSKRKLTPPIPVTYSDLGRGDKKKIGQQAPDTIIYFKEDGEMTLDPNEGKMRIAKAKVLLPFTQVFEQSGLSYNEFKELYLAGKVDPKIFKEIIGYRIPNQSVSSSDSFEIVGILPPLAGDQAIVYNEITAKTGSDFDIDKMYLMMPYFDTNRKFSVPEDNTQYRSELNAVLGASYPDISNYVKIPWLADKNGKQILSRIMKSSPGIKEALNEMYSTKQLDDKPMGSIMNNLASLVTIAESEMSSFKDPDTGELLFVSEVMKDVYRAHSKRNSEVKEDKRAAVNKIRKKWGSSEVTEISYTPANFNGLRNAKNRLIELYTSILEAPVTYDDLMSPLDSTIIKDTILDVLYKKDKAMGKTTEEFDTWVDNRGISGLEQMFPVELVNARVDVLDAKSLISVMANNMTDLGESQKVDFGLKYNTGFNETSLARIYQLNQDGDPEAKISKIVSYGMNAAVDAAKDPYIIQGNFTTYTSNSAMMLLRLGIPLDKLFTILTNDTIMAFSNERINAKAKVSAITPEISNKDLKKEAQSIATQLEAGASIFDIISEEDFLSNAPGKQDAIRGYWYLLQEAGKEFNNAVVAMKSDANGPGKSLPQMLAYLNRIDRMQLDFTVNSGQKWFKNGITEDKKAFNPNIGEDADAKVLGVMANNTLFLMKEVSSKLFIEAKPEVIDTVNNMAARLGSPLTTDETLIKLLYNYLYPYLLYNTGHPMYKFPTGNRPGGMDEETYLLNQLPGVVAKAKAANKENLFLNSLIVTSKARENFIKFVNSANLPKEEQVKMKEAVTELMETDRQLVDDIVKYSYLTSGFKSGIFTFHQFLPANYFINNFHGVFVEKFLANSSFMVDPGTVLTLIAMSNPNNFKIVKRAPKDFTRTPSKEEVLEKLEILNPNGETAYVPFVNRRGTLYVLESIENGLPIYNTIDRADTGTEFNLYNYDKMRAEITPHSSNVMYSSVVKDLYQDKTPIDAHRGDVYAADNAPLENIDKVMTKEGKTIRDLGITQEAWDGLTDPEKQNIIDCH